MCSVNRTGPTITHVKFTSAFVYKIVTNTQLDTYELDIIETKMSQQTLTLVVSFCNKYNLKSYLNCQLISDSFFQF